MRHLDENIKELNQLVIESLRNIERMLKITIEELRSDVLNKEIYGEAKVIEEDINDNERLIDERAISIIARFQPAAGDLRLVIGAMNINRELERIGNICINTLRTIKRLFKENPELKRHIVPMEDLGLKVLKMYEIFIDAYVEHKIENAYLILGLEDEIDGLKKEYITKIKEQMKEDVEYLDLGIENLLISKNYEKIADEITSMAEILVYIAKGKDLRHKEWGASNESIGD